VAFPVIEAAAGLRAGDEVALEGVQLVLDGGGLRARANGSEIPAHEAFWFAWSQFHADTKLWPEG
jgi:hypothetical protein